MKYYIVSEEELYKDIKTYINHGLGNMDAELLTSAILKSKQPVDDIEKENIELKSKLENIRYLDRDRVEEILYKNSEHDILHSSQFFMSACEICQLAIPEVKYLNKQSVEKIIDDMIAEISGTVGFHRCHQATESNYYKLAVKRLCLLAIKEGK